MIILKVTPLTTPLDLGAFLSGANYDVQQVTNQEIKVLAYPSGAPVSVILPPSTINAQQNLNVVVADALGTAGVVNAITIQAGLSATAVQASFTGSIAGTVLTVTAVGSGALANGQTIDGLGVVAATAITSLGTGTGGVGTYNINNSQTVSSESMTSGTVETINGASTIVVSTNYGSADLQILTTGAWVGGLNP